jgi:hypothetical protein
MKKGIIALIVVLGLNFSVQGAEFIEYLRCEIDPEAELGDVVILQDLCSDSDDALLVFLDPGMPMTAVIGKEKNENGFIFIQKLKDGSTFTIETSENTISMTEEIDGEVFEENYHMTCRYVGVQVSC